MYFLMSTWVLLFFVSYHLYSSKCNFLPIVRNCLYGLNHLYPLLQSVVCQEYKYFVFIRSKK